MSLEHFKEIQQMSDLSCPYDPDFEVVAGTLTAYYGSAVDIVLPRGIYKIDKEVFSGDSYLHSVILSADVEVIGEKAFFNCSDLEWIQWSARLKEIGDSAFEGCSSLTQNRMTDKNLLQFPKGIRKIGKRAFAKCKKLKTVIIPAGLESIGQETFSECSGLTALQLPSGISDLNRNSFLVNKCEKLEKIIYPRELGQKDAVGAFWGSKWFETMKERNARARKVWLSQNKCPDCGKALKGIIKKRCIHCHRYGNWQDNSDIYYKGIKDKK